MALDKGKVVYQIYPKSYKDTTGNGIGDFRGIIEKIPYLVKLGVDMVWLNPFYPSPQRDNGYDISDYMAVDPLFGDMADFEEMVRVGKEHKIDFMLDMVLNHCSTEHEWFQKALAGDQYYQDFFFIQDQPTDWQSKFGGSAWAPFGDTGKYYLHLFDETQADLNWRNPNVRKELFKVVNFWRDKGVKGFRFDVINLIGKDEVLVDCPEYEGKPAYTDKPIVHDYLRMMNQATFGTDDSFMTVGEMSSTTMENCVLYSAPDRQELSMTFNFHHLKVDYKDGQKWTLAPFDFEELKKVTQALRMAKRIILFGVGSSGLTAEDFKFKLMRIGYPIDAVTNNHFMYMQASLMKEGDVAIGISHTGYSEETYKSLKLAKENGAITIALTHNMRSPITNVSDYVLVNGNRQGHIQGDSLGTRMTQLFVLDLIYMLIVQANPGSALEFKQKTMQVLQDHRLPFK